MRRAMICVEWVVQNLLTNFGGEDVAFASHGGRTNPPPVFAPCANLKAEHRILVVFQNRVFAARLDLNAARFKRNRTGCDSGETHGKNGDEALHG